MIQNNKIQVSILVSLYRCELFLDSFFTYSEKINHKENYEFLLLHNDPSEKELAIIEKHTKGKSYYKHTIIPERERLYQTWNRGIRLAEAEYLTIWNVDDIRFPDSIEEQKRVLDTNPEAAIVYGDIYLSTQYGVQGNTLTNSPLWSKQNKNEFCRSYYMSCFQMWRKSIHKSIGFYDEQFLCSADFDFQIRAALHYPFAKTPNPIGIYLEEYSHKISYNGKQQFENDVIYLRYGVFDKINLLTLSKSKRIYRRGMLLFYGKWEPFTERSPFSLFYKIKGVLISILKLPKSILKLLVRNCQKNNK